MELYKNSEVLYEFQYDFVQKLLGYGLLGFSLDISLVPFLGFC